MGDPKVYWGTMCR